MVLSVQSISEIPISTLNHLANQNNDAGKSTEISEPSTERIKIQPPSSFYTLKSCHLRVLCSLSKLSETEMSRFRQLVTDKTVDIYFKGDTSFSPLELLIRCNQSDSLLPCLKLLLEREDATCDKNALMLLLRHNSSGVVIECAKLLIERGVKVQHTDAVGRNAVGHFPTEKVHFCWLHQWDNAVSHTLINSEKKKTISLSFFYSFVWRLKLVISNDIIFSRLLLPNCLYCKCFTQK